MRWIRYQANDTDLLLRLVERLPATANLRYCEFAHHYFAGSGSCGLFVLGDSLVSPHDVDLTTCGMVLEKNGEIVATGAGAAALGSPVNAIAWLANTLGAFGIALQAGEVILSGSLAALIPVQAGDSMNMKIGGIGSASVRFV